MRAASDAAKSLVMGLALSMSGAMAQAETSDWSPSKSEAALLPRFCWQQMLGNVQGPEYTIPRSTCGDSMNHYCVGLVDLGRANRTIGDKRKRATLLKVARKDTEYTLRAMEKFPNCQIRAHAEKTMADIEAQLRALR